MDQDYGRKQDHGPQVSWETFKKSQQEGEKKQEISCKQKENEGGPAENQPEEILFALFQQYILIHGESPQSILFYLKNNL